ncbi:GMC family oxidoreductase N-terminal domain-containing protein [Undibacterium parvum]|uniref:GMC family oxidoreductase n=1 Tax=Undibacterium parvum TaxID=401471 RepID=A0A3Q9BQ16_9BURK|nr:GMC family oxidoreductase N-terminal domain-containing protein [Undibacterium parvum]AZP11899.1 GMC family oxidoreductase [Undibacterium parvum]
MQATHKNLFDVIVIGSGPGGATVAREMARQGQRVLILERGSNAPLTGKLSQMAAIAAIPGRGAYFNRDASLLVQGVTAGGSSAINFATAMAPPLPLFDAYGVDLRAALSALQSELPLAPLPDNLLGPAAQQLLQAARSLGHNWQKLDKMIYPSLCRTGCWRCVYGCPYGAKWSARNFLEQAIADGAEMLTGATVRKILQQDSTAVGVEYQHEGRLQRVYAGRIVLAAGGIASPQLLHASGLLAAGASHFSDPVVAVMGSLQGLHAGAEVPMAAGMHLPEAGIMLADMSLPRPMYQAFAMQVGRFDRLLAHQKTLTLMVKIRDQIGGSIGTRWVNKSLQAEDQQKLRHGVALANTILRQAGATQIFKSWHFAAHPGGSIRIGAGVDSDLQSSTKNLFVCDASVIPTAWGLPPTLTLLCLGKRLADHLASA